MRTWRTVRVFISSTFRDMHAERDYLVKFIKSPQDTPQLAEGRNASFLGLFFHEDAPQLAGG